MCERRPAPSGETSSKVIDAELVKIMSWYDNQWGYAAQMLRKALIIERSNQNQVAP